MMRFMQRIEASSLSPGPIRLAKWQRDRGISRSTVWRFRQRDWLRGVFVIAGVPYISQEAAVEFDERARRGDFAHLDPVHKPKQSSGLGKGRGQ